MTRPRLAVLAIATVCIIAGGASCHDLIYDRDPNFCCLDEAHCAAGGAPEGMTFPCTRPGDVCDVDRNACIPDPSIVDCNSSDDCTAVDPSRPACVDGQCVACGDEVHFCPATEPVCSASYVCEACADETSCSRFADTPFCSGTSGECVACRPGNDVDCDSATAPICDQEAETCRACRSGECPSGVCDTGAGACVADADIIFVAMDGSDAGTCTRTAPCRSIQRGINVAGARRWMTVGAGDYDTFTITGATLTILAAPGANVSRIVVGPVVDISGAANVTIDGLRVHDGPGASGDGIRCSESGADSPVLTLRQVTSDRNTGMGVKASGCSVTIDQSTIAVNTAGGIDVDGGSATITNSMITMNGGLGSSVGGVKLDSVSALSFQFNTVGGNGTLSESFAAGIQCSALAPVTLANNIIHGTQANEVTTPAPNCAFAFNLSNQVLGGSNVSTTATAAALFVDPTMGNFHSKPTSPAVGAADPAATMTVDFDGDARPAPAGTQRDIGADEVSQ